MEFSAKSAKQIFEVFLVYIVSYRFIFLQALSSDPERGMRVEELERLLAVETGGEELGAHTFLVCTKESFQQNLFGRDLRFPRRGRDRSCDDGCTGSRRSKRLLNHAGVIVVV